MSKKIMAVFLALMCVLTMGMLTACGDLSEPAAEAEEQLYPMEVEDNDYFTFTITEYDDIWEDYSYSITNKTNQNFTLSGESVVANDEVTLDSFIYCDVNGGTKANDSFSITEDELSDFEDGETVKITVNYKLYNSDTYNDITIGSFSFEITK